MRKLADERDGPVTHSSSGPTLFPIGGLSVCLPGSQSVSSVSGYKQPGGGKKEGGQLSSPETTQKQIGNSARSSC